MAAVVRLPTISDGAAHLDASCLHAAGKSAQWLFGDSLPTKRQVGIRDLFDFFWSVEQGHMNRRRSYFMGFRPVAAFSRPDATSTAVEWIITMDLAQCTARSVTVVGGGANPPGSPGFRARRLQPLLDERAVAQVRIHPSQRRPLARPCAHTDCRALSTLALVQAVAGLLCGSLFGPLLGAAAAAVAARCPCPRRCCPQPPLPLSRMVALMR